ncbi:MAG: site-specific integrase [Prevotellaceae bacterium]|jgi:integrase|nr:site-specific integrase [Prevotellaceae bacterium]
MDTAKKATYNIVYNRKNKLNSDGRALIQIVVYLPSQKKRKFLSTGIYIAPGEWDEQNKKVKKNNPSYIEINRIIKNTINSIEEYEYKIITENKVFSLTKLENYVFKKNISTSSFIDFYENEIKLNQSIEHKTRKEHRYTLSILSEFRRNITFNEINYQLAQEFDNWMRSIKKLSQNTIHKHHEHVKRFLNLATQKEIYDASKSSYKKFISRKVESNRENLTVEQILALEQLIIPEQLDELREARDMFLFSCYAGLRYSDMQALSKSNVRKDSAGNICIRFQMQKVDRYIELPLNSLFDGKPAKILKYYMDFGKEKIFPQHSNQQINRLLKIIAVSANIRHTRLTFHVARHTFGTLLAEKTQNPYLVMDLMGHNDIDTSMIYIHRSQERINQQLRNVKWDL